MHTNQIDETHDTQNENDIDIIMQQIDENLYTSLYDIQFIALHKQNVIANDDDTISNCQNIKHNVIERLHDVTSMIEKFL